MIGNLLQKLLQDKFYVYIVAMNFSIVYCLVSFVYTGKDFDMTGKHIWLYIYTVAKFISI